MIQRIQSIYLLLSGLCLILYFFLPFALFNVPLIAGKAELSITGLKILSDDVLPQLPGMSFQLELTEIKRFTAVAKTFAILISLLSLIILFIYRKRKLQLKLGYLNMLLCTIFLAVLFLHIDKIEESTGSEPNFRYGMIIPLFQFLLIFLANRGIKKDEELVRSVDRLR